MKNYFLISCDPYFIADRLKEIDANYFVLFSRKSGKFEVHCLGQIGGTFCFSLPFDSLDARAIDYCLKTRAQNVEKIVQEIEMANQKLEKDNLKNAKNKLMEVLS